jgi:hypothetical protein
MKLACQGFDTLTFQVPNVRRANVETMTLNSDGEYEKGLLLTNDRTVHGLFSHLGEFSENSQLTKKQSRRLAQRKAKAPYYGYFNSDKSIYCVSTELFFEIQFHGLFFLKYSAFKVIKQILDYLKNQGLSFYLSRTDYQLTIRGNRDKFFALIWQDCSYSDLFELAPKIKAGSVKGFEAEYSRISVVGYDKKSHLDSLSDSPYRELFKQKHTDNFEDLFRVEFRLHYADKNKSLTELFQNEINEDELKKTFFSLVQKEIQFPKQLKQFISGGRYEK